MRSVQVPKWILVFGFFLGLIGLVAGALGIVQPTAFFNDFPRFSQWPEIQYVTTGWGVRGVSAGLAMMFALWLRTPGAIATIFCMRFFTELGDLFNTLVTGHGTLGLSHVVLTVIWISLFLVPEAIAARWGVINVSNQTGRA